MLVDIMMVVIVQLSAVDLPSQQ